MDIRQIGESIRFGLVMGGTREMIDASAQREANCAAAWPLDAQEELAAIAREFEAALRGELYHPTAEEAAGIARGLEAAEAGRFVSEADVASVIARHRPA